MADESKYLALTKDEAELLMDTFNVSHPTTRSLVLKVASTVLEWAAADGLTAVERLLQPTGTGGARAA